MGVQRDNAQSLRWVLRQQTRASHQALDDIAGSFDLQTVRGLQDFLHANACAYQALRPFDNFFDGHIARRLGLIHRDLKLLDGSQSQSPATLDPPTKTTALGFRYVIAGSSLGGRMLARHQAKSPNAKVVRATAFLADPELEILWRHVLMQLEDVPHGGQAAQDAVTGANACFDLFERAFALQSHSSSTENSG